MLRLTRLGNSLLAFGAIFLPMFVRTNDLRISVGRAIPLLFICVCTFVANDVDDVEQDRVNHPERPLPSGHLSPAVAGITYFTSLALALFTTKYYVTQGIAFWYYGLIATSISYGYILSCLPSLKAPFVAVVSSAPILIVAIWYPDELKLYVVATSVFLVSLGREMCMDITDRAGDRVSFMHRFNPKTLAIVAFCLNAVGLLLLVGQTRKLGEVIFFTAIVGLLALAALQWFKYAKYDRASFIMKLQLVVGLYFLL
jgi:geranylgeranylglycerol-phosphate geranylgeranyltransferase